MVNLNLPLRPWVPQWVGLAVLFYLFLPFSMLNGTYTGTMQELSGTLGVLSEDISMGYYATAVGMAVAYPIVKKIHTNLAPKTMLLSDLTLQVLLCLACANTQSIDLIICISFAIGFLKAFIMLWLIIHVQPFLTPRNVRSEFYAYFFPIVFGGGQLSVALTALLAYYYDWRLSYYFMALLLLVGILLVLIFFRFAKTQFHIPLRDLHLRSMFLAAVGVLMVLYILAYGRTLDWFASPTIQAYAVAAPLLLGLFLWHQSTMEHPYVSLQPLTSGKRLLGYAYMMIVMFFSASNSLVSNFLTGFAGVDCVHTNMLCLWLLPGFGVGAVVCFWWFRWQRWRFRYLVGAGMGCFALCFALLYFRISPTCSLELLYLPTFFRGVGMMTLVIAFSLYVVEHLDMKYMQMNAFYLIMFRSVLSPMAGMAFFSNWIYRLEAHSLPTLATTVTAADPVAATSYGGALAQAAAGGHGYAEAAQLAATTVGSALQQQALLVAIRTQLGWLLAAALVLAVVSCFIPFHRTVRVKVVRTGSDMV